MSKTQGNKVAIPKKPEDFVLDAIKGLRDEDKSKGIDVRISGREIARL